jgi:hypothetical protein
MLRFFMYMRLVEIKEESIYTNVKMKKKSNFSAYSESDCRIFSITCIKKITLCLI